MAECFWTDLLNATQVCGGGGGPPPVGYDGAILLSTGGSAPYLMAWRFNSQTGFGSAYPTRDPLVQGNVVKAVFSPDGRFLATAGNPASVAYANNCPVYEWDAETGFGDVVSQPFDASGFCEGLAWSPDNNALATTHNRFQNPPVVSAYEWDPTAGEFLSKYPGPTTVPPNTATEVEFCPDGESVAYSHYNSPTISAYSWDYGTGFGPRYVQPQSLPSMSANQGWRVGFHPSGKVIVWVIQDVPRVLAYEYDSATGFGARYADPSTIPNSRTEGMAFSPDGRAVAFAHRNAPYVTVYPFERFVGFGTKFADPSVPVAGLALNVEFSPDSTCIAIGHQVSPFCTVYKWSHATGFLEKLPNPSTLPTGQVHHITFHPDTQ